MPGGGTITIRSSRCRIDDGAAAAVTDARSGRFICLSVGDTGEGMDRATADQIFEPFYSTKETGTGLGLSVVYGIVKGHEGWLNVRTEPGCGTTMEVYLPAVESDDAEDGPKAATQRRRAHDGARILLVEDEETVRSFARSVLLRGGYEVHEAVDTGDAMRVFMREQGRFHLVLSDVVLPDGNGVDLVEEMLALQPGLPVILSSGYTDEESQWPLIRKRGYPFLPKPYRLDALLDLVATVLDKAAAATGSDRPDDPKGIDDPLS